LEGEFPEQYTGKNNEIVGKEANVERRRGKRVSSPGRKGRQGTPRRLRVLTGTVNSRDRLLGDIYTERHRRANKKNSAFGDRRKDLTMGEKSHLQA